jgi:hypothetical protein
MHAAQSSGQGDGGDLLEVIALFLLIQRIASFDASSLAGTCGMTELSRDYFCDLMPFRESN